jgi:hypothetical protein
MVRVEYRPWSEGPGATTQTSPAPLDFPVLSGIMTANLQPPSQDGHRVFRRVAIILGVSSIIALAALPGTGTGAVLTSTLHVISCGFPGHIIDE